MYTGNGATSIRDRSSLLLYHPFTLFSFNHPTAWPAARSRRCSRAGAEGGEQPAEGAAGSSKGVGHYRLRSFGARFKKTEDWVALGFPDTVPREHGIAAASRRHTGRLVVHGCLDGPAQAFATPAVSVEADYGRALVEFLEADNTLSSQ